MAKLEGMTNDQIVDDHCALFVRSGFVLRHLENMPLLTELILDVSP